MEEGAVTDQLHGSDQLGLMDRALERSSSASSQERHNRFALESKRDSFRDNNVLERLFPHLKMKHNWLPTTQGRADQTLLLRSMK